LEKLVGEEEGRKVSAGEEDVEMEEFEVME
jgi:hypothetical protein